MCRFFWVLILNYNYWGWSYCRSFCKYISPVCNIVQRAFPDCSLRGAAETLADFRARCLASPEITTIRPSGFHNCHGLRLLFWRKYPHPAMPDRCYFLHFNHSPTCHHSVFFREILIVTKNHLDILLIVSKMPHDSENIIKYQHPSLHKPYHSQVIQWMTALLLSWRGQALGCLAWKKAEFLGWKTLMKDMNAWNIWKESGRKDAATSLNTIQYPVIIDCFFCVSLILTHVTFQQEI